MSQTPEYLHRLLEQQSRQDRLLVVISGELDWVETQRAIIVNALASVKQFGSAEGQMALNHAKALLGQSLDNVLVNCFDGFNPNAIAALSGCVKGGGVMVLLVPPLDDWASFDCPDYQRMRVHNVDAPTFKHFLQRCSDVLYSDHTHLLVQQNQPFLAPKTTDDPASIDAAFPYRSGCQEHAVKLLIKMATGHRNRPLVLHAARGRGKSASLGIAANQLLKQGKTIAFVAPFRSALESAFQQLDDRCQLQFYPPDVFERVRPEVDVVFIDEAAAIAVPLLHAWAKHYPRIAFSSTSFGYEGHGQGFLKRFLPQLSIAKPQFQQYEMQEAIRFRSPCSLEDTVNRLFLMGGVREQYTYPSTDLQCAEISQHQLLDDEHLLNTVHQLLLSAHYQTTPDDVRVLLDGANTRLFACFNQQQLKAVALIAEEGALEHELHEPIFGAERRVKGHLAPQFLTVNGCHTAYLKLSTWRVVRIATDVEARRQAYGSTLLQYVEHVAIQSNVDYLSAVFGTAPEVLPFWSKLGFDLQVINNKIDSVSAQLTGAVIKPLSDSAYEVVEIGRELNQQQLLVTIRQQSVNLSVEQVCALLKAAKPKYRLTDFDFAVLSAFAVGNKPLHACVVSLERLALSGGFNQESIPDGLKLIVMSVFMSASSAQITAATDVIGQKLQLKTMRSFVKLSLGTNPRFTS